MVDAGAAEGSRLPAVPVNGKNIMTAAANTITAYNCFLHMAYSSLVECILKKMNETIKTVINQPHKKPRRLKTRLDSCFLCGLASLRENLDQTWFDPTVSV
jgi:hypothetical protein